MSTKYTTCMYIRYAIYDVCLYVGPAVGDH